MVKMTTVQSIMIDGLYQVTIEHPYSDCDRCGRNLKYSGSHYHCGGCDSLEATSSYGHHTSIHIVNHKITEVGFHHCTMTTQGECNV